MQEANLAQLEIIEKVDDLRRCINGFVRPRRGHVEVDRSDMCETMDENQLEPPNLVLVV